MVSMKFTVSRTKMRQLVQSLFHVILNAENRGVADMSLGMISPHAHNFLSGFSPTAFTVFSVSLFTYVEARCFPAMFLLF